MRKLLLVLGLAGLLVAGTGCTSQNVHDVTPQAFLTAAAEPGVTVIDVRTPEEYAAGHLQGAINIDVEDPGFADAVAELDQSATYAVYCHSGRRSALASSAMAKDGFTDIYNLEGGIADLQAAGGAVVTS